MLHHHHHHHHHHHYFMSSKSSILWSKNVTSLMPNFLYAQKTHMKTYIHVQKLSTFSVVNTWYNLHSLPISTPILSLAWFSSSSSFRMENTKFVNHLVTGFTFENPEKKIKTNAKRKEEKNGSTLVCKET